MKEFSHVYSDIMMASGKLSADTLPGDMTEQECVLGFEYCGRDTQGRRIMGVVVTQAMATSVIIDPGFAWVVPDKWTMEEASTVPCVYATSYYALYVRGNLKPGESVLIHAGSGGVGQASIALCLHAGCKVFTTVGSKEKRQFLKKRFPELTDRQIGNSRDASFEQMILSETQGKGVDIVLNSLAGDLLQASIRCLAQDGRFLEIGKFDMSQNTAVGMSMFLKNTSFHGVLLDALSVYGTAEKKQLWKLMDEGLKNGAIRPLPVAVFNEQQVSTKNT